MIDAFTNTPVPELQSRSSQRTRTLLSTLRSRRERQGASSQLQRDEARECSKGLDLAHWDPDHAQVLVLGAKGRKDRKVFLEEGGARSLARWLELRGEEPGPLICPVTRGGRVRLRRLSDQAVIAVTQRRGKEAGIRPFTPHDLRRSCASDLIDAGEDMVTVRDHLGHASVQTTERYDRRGDERLKRAVGKLHWAG